VTPPPSGRPIIGHRDAPELHVMSYNIRRRMNHVVPNSPDLWSHRRGALRRQLALEQPAILGTQEALFEQARFVGESLGPSYRRIGRGRNANGRGEGTPVFFDARRLTLVSWQQLALSDTPDVAGSRGWGNITPRMLVSAIFTDRVTGTTFHFINTHFDQFSRRARLKSADALLRLIAASDLPAIVTGDFNTSVGTGPYERLTQGTNLADTWFSAEERLTEDWGSFPNYRAPRLDRKRIDWILATTNVQVEQAAINDARFGGIAASDHLPVQAVLRLG
jgi:endonuclease/exonuclease/phosphatase family metal-dependent hydrolase